MDEMTDEESFGTLVESEDGRYRAWFLCIMEKNPSFAVRGGDLHKYEDRGEDRPTMWRTDKNPSNTSIFKVTKDGWVVQPDKWITLALANHIRRAESRFVIRGSGDTAVFSVDGAEDAITKFLERCGSK